MGNCQTSDTAAPVAEIEHPDGKRERIYWPINASHVMTSNPGYYVALVTDSVDGGDGRSPARQVRLLRPDDCLRVGQLYRLVSYEEVIREFGTKKRMRLSRLLQKQKERDERRRSYAAGGDFENRSTDKVEEEGREELVQTVGPTIICKAGSQRQWRPTLLSIAEAGN
ncbi:hypothetical protein KSP39_PZI015277 [Platanthera zijinensis]|uniref:Uncharacterized protein n=1 Tax=Platanthera zijinensis TaxID=2320716 RepID=A0AAP0G187_9ASPA